MVSSAFVAPEFLKRTNIYEVNIRQYTPEGTFNAFAAHLPGLKDMGVEILWLMPIHPIGTKKCKGSLGSYYSIKDHKGVNSEFGTADDLRELITKVHESGMKIIIDWVANHAAWDHVWTISNPEFFVRDEEGNFKPPFDWDDVIQIDHGNPDEQSAMKEAMQYWVKEFDIDGFRADLAHLTPLEFWKDARLKLSPLKKDLIWLAETEEPTYHEAFDISYTWDWMHATEKFYRKEISLNDCITVLEKYKNDFPSPALKMFFTSNHDENSWNGTEYEKYGRLAKVLAVFSCTYPGVALTYSGQELPNMKRLKFFEKDVIDWKPVNELHDFYKRLFLLRKENKAVAADSNCVFIKETASKNILAYRNTNEDDEIIILLNMNEHQISEKVFLEAVKGRFKDVFTGEEAELTEKYTFNADAGAFIILEKMVPQM